MRFSHIYGVAMNGRSASYVRGRLPASTMVEAHSTSREDTIGRARVISDKGAVAIRPIELDHRHIIDDGTPTLRECLD